MQLLKSTAIKAVSHQRGQLTIVFHSGSTHTYRGVGERVYLELMQAGSPGRYYVSEIRGCYDSHKGDAR